MESATQLLELVEDWIIKAMCIMVMHFKASRLKKYNLALQVALHRVEITMHIYSRSDLETLEMIKTKKFLELQPLKVNQIAYKM